MKADADGTPTMSISQDTRRHRDLAKLAIGAKDLNLDAETLAAMVFRVSHGRTSSRAGLDQGERALLLAELKAAGFRPQIKPKPRPVQQAIAASTKEALAGKVRALLLDAGRDDAYANSIAERRFDVLRWEWLPYVELRKLVQMLAIDAQRRQRRAEAAQ